MIKKGIASDPINVITSISVYVIISLFCCSTFVYLFSAILFPSDDDDDDRYKYPQVQMNNNRESLLGNNSL